MAFEASWLQQRLGEELAAARDAAGLSVRDVGERLDWHHSKVSRVERAEVKTTSADVISLAKLYGLPDSEAERLCVMARQSRTKIWWKAYREVISSEYYDLIGYENDAVRIDSLHSTVIDGLLQTREYMTALLKLSEFVRDPDRVDGMIEVRQLRQRRLTEPTPLIADFTIDESVLSIPYGGQAVQVNQLHYLLKVAERPNVTIRVLPTSVATERGPFTVYSFGGDEGPAIASFDALSTNMLTDSPMNVRAARRVLQAAQNRSLSPEDSATFISKKIEEYS